MRALQWAAQTVFVDPPRVIWTLVVSHEGGAPPEAGEPLGTGSLLDSPRPGQPSSSPSLSPASSGGGDFPGSREQRLDPPAPRHLPTPTAPAPCARAAASARRAPPRRGGAAPARARAEGSAGCRCRMGLCVWLSRRSLHTWHLPPLSIAASESSWSQKDFILGAGGEKEINSQSISPRRSLGLLVPAAERASL